MFNNLLHSGWHFERDESFRKNQYEMLNVAILLSSLALIFGIFNNMLSEFYLLVYVEVTILIMTLSSAYLLRASRNHFNKVTNYLALQFMLFFVALILFSEPAEMKHLWIFTYPLVIFFFKGSYTWIYWIFTLCLLLLMAKIQPFVATPYNMFQIFYIELVLIIITSIIYYYDFKISRDHDVIMKQNNELKQFSDRLEEEVAQKTQALLEGKLRLEEALTQKESQLQSQKDMLMLQSRQATMGELFSMIAHQWRQPLSNMSLQIVNRKLSATALTNDEQTLLEHLELSINYLNETLENFQSFFRPQHAPAGFELLALISQAKELILPRLHAQRVKLHIDEFVCSINSYKNDLLQVLLILLNNAIDALQTSMVETRRITINVQQQQQCYISISDNAGGIEALANDEIFTPHYSTKNKDEGVSGEGIGLHIAKLITTTKLHGTIAAKNTTDGAMFTLTLPLTLQGAQHG